MELLSFTLKLDDDERLVSGSLLNLEGPVLHVFLDLLIRELSTDESLGVEDSVFGVSSDLVLGCISNESFILSKGDIGWSGVVSLIIGDDFNLVVKPHTNA
jgi:hypothetical protein